MGGGGNDSERTYLLFIRIVKDVNTCHDSISLCGVSYAELLKRGSISKVKQSLGLRLSVRYDFFVLIQLVGKKWNKD